MFELYNEDCNKRLNEIASASVDLVVTSPPYDDLRTYNNLVWNRKWVPYA